MRTVEDDQHHRWASASDVRKVIPKLPRNEVLLLQFPERMGNDAVLSDWRLQADSLLTYLAKSMESNSIKFRNRLQREVVNQAAKIRQRLGINDAVPVASRSPPQDFTSTMIGVALKSREGKALGD